MKFRKYLKEWNQNWEEDLEDFVDSVVNKNDIYSISNDIFFNTLGDANKYIKNSTEIIEMVLKDCAPFVKEISKIKRFVFRGSYSVAGNKDFYRFQSRLKDRTPTDSDIIMHNLFNEAAKEVLGWPVRNGVMTGNESDAEAYGSEHFLFFPIGKYSYAWDTKVSDRVFHAELDDPKDVDPWDYDDFSPEKVIKAVAKEKDRILKTHERWKERQIKYIKKNFRTNGLADALKRGYEISFNCKYYYLIDIKYETPLEIALFE